MPPSHFQTFTNRNFGGPKIGTKIGIKCEEYSENIVINESNYQIQQHYAIKLTLTVYTITHAVYNNYIDIRSHSPPRCAAA